MPGLPMKPVVLIVGLVPALRDISSALIWKSALCVAGKIPISNEI